MHAICPVEITRFYLFNCLKNTRRRVQSMKFSLSYFPFPPVNSIFLFPNILFKISFSNSILFLEWENELHTPIKQEVAYDFVF